jgi:hypothetical protein
MGLKIMDEKFSEFNILNGTYPWVIASDRIGWLALNLETGKTRRVPVRIRASFKAFIEAKSIVEKRNQDHQEKLTSTTQKLHKLLNTRAYQQTKRERKTMSVIYYLPQDLAYLQERLPSLATDLLVAMSEANCLAYALEYKIDVQTLERFTAKSTAHLGQSLSNLGNPNELVTILRELQLLRYNTKSNSKDHLSMADNEQFEGVYREACIKVLATLQTNQTLRIYGIEFRAVTSTELIATIYNPSFERQQRRVRDRLENPETFYDQWFARAVQLLEQHQATIEEILAMQKAD